MYFASPVLGLPSALQRSTQGAEELPCRSGTGRTLTTLVHTHRPYRLAVRVPYSVLSALHKVRRSCRAVLGLGVHWSTRTVPIALQCVCRTRSCRSPRRGRLHRRHHRRTTSARCPHSRITESAPHPGSANSTGRTCHAHRPYRLAVCMPYSVLPITPQRALAPPPPPAHRRTTPARCPHSRITGSAPHHGSANSTGRTCPPSRAFATHCAPPHRGTRAVEPAIHHGLRAAPHLLYWNLAHTRRPHRLVMHRTCRSPCRGRLHRRRRRYIGPRAPPPSPCRAHAVLGTASHPAEGACAAVAAEPCASPPLPPSLAHHLSEMPTL